MAVRLQELGISALVALLCATAAGQTSTSVTQQKSAAPAKTARRHTKKQPVKPAVPEPTPVVEQQPPTPPPPKRPYEMSPVPPQVTYTGGRLTIIAPNSSLADILNAVKARTGTHIEFPSSAAQERVAVEVGPGTPRDVLAELLEGSPFDYVLLGSDQDPTAVTEIILTRRQGGATAVASGARNPAPQQPEPAASDEDSDNEPAQAQAPTPGAPAGSGPPAPGQPVNMAQPQPMGAPTPMQNADQNAPAAQSNVPTPTQPAQQGGPKTPEQLLMELQQMQKRENQQPPPKPPQN